MFFFFKPLEQHPVSLISILAANGISLIKRRPYLIRNVMSPVAEKQSVSLAHFCCCEFVFPFFFLESLLGKKENQIFVSV